MKRTCWVCMLVFVFMLNWSLVYAGDFYVIPVKKCCTCKGTLVGTRWCDNGDGTVTDMNTCLFWLKKADWGGFKKWEDCTTHDDVHTRAGLLAAGSAGADLSDGSSVGDWRLPTKTELYNLANGTEAVRSSNMRAFTGVQSSNYWSSTTYEGDSTFAWYVYMDDGFVFNLYKGSSIYVWPVRSGN